jgi:hypothetical protein
MSEHLLMILLITESYWYALIRYNKFAYYHKDF